jgi:hypothetical protein
MACEHCGRDHPEEMSDDILGKLLPYEQRIDDIIAEIAKESYDADPGLSRDLQISFLNTLAAKLVGQSGTISFERQEELHPELQSRQALSLAFTLVTDDVIGRLTGMYAGFLQDGKLPNVTNEMAERAKEATDSATVH